MLTKAETNNAIVVRLTNVRKHPNADRLKLATVLGTQVVVGLDAVEGQLVVYFDSNLQLLHDYLHCNNLYSNESLNADTTTRGYFGMNGRVKAQRLRGEISNGYVAKIDTLRLPGINPSLVDELNEGDEFTHIGGIEICHKYITVKGAPGSHAGNKCMPCLAENFWRHWETHHLMRETNTIPIGPVRLEEKIHGTSGRTGNLLCCTGKRWWQFWRPAKEYRIVSGTRRVDHIQGHIPEVRRRIEEQVAPKLHQGEELYYEIYGYDIIGKRIQKLSDYGVPAGEFRVLLYRVTITTPDGQCYDLSRKEVDKRAEELGWEKPTVLWEGWYGIQNTPYGGHPEMGAEIADLLHFADRKSALDLNTLREGFVFWFQRPDGSWTCLKHKSAEFLAAESALKDEGGGDVEDAL